MKPTAAGVTAAGGGFGLGLRPPHYREIAERAPALDWLEIVSENFMVEGGPALRHLDRLRPRYPVIMHGVSLSIGGTDPLDESYLGRLAALAARIEPLWISDHLCWTSVGRTQLHDLLPLPWTREALDHVAARVHHVQERLQRPVVLENVSAYLGFRASEMSETDFMRELVRRTGCQLLLDVNNLYVSSRNLGFDPATWLAALPAGSVRQIHLAGHEVLPDVLIDTHDRPVSDPVWDLYALAVARLGPVATMIERDADIPPLDELLTELSQARSLCERTLATSARRAA